MMMKAVCLNAYGGPEDLVYADVPRPISGPGEVLVQVRATAITPSEFSWPGTWKTADGANRPFPIIPGHEFSGVVAALGPEVPRDAEVVEGASVYGLNDWDRQGTEAEYCLARPAALALTPRTLDHVHAAEVPISGLTAWQALFDHAHLARGQRVLVHGATGGVGSFAVQLASGAGAHVIATTSTAHVEAARALGAEEVVDYTRVRFEAVVRDVDLVVDTVGGEVLERSWGVLRPGGTLVTTVAPLAREPAEAHGVRAIFFVVEANRAQLGELARQIDAGQLRPCVAAVYQLETAPEAYAYARDGHPQGKVVLRISE